LRDSKQTSGVEKKREKSKIELNMAQLLLLENKQSMMKPVLSSNQTTTANLTAHGPIGYGYANSINN
jgi:hypothetical protein